MTRVLLDASKIIDWTTFHSVFKTTFGFPDYYGANMHAWIDCMTYLDDSDAGMTRITVEPGEILILEIPNSDEFKKRSPEQYEALLDGAAFVNWRRVDIGEPPVLAIILS